MEPFPEVNLNKIDALGKRRRDPKKIRQRRELKNSPAMPFLTFCPVFVDHLYWPMENNKELTFEKLDLVQGQSIFLKDYTYKG